MKEGVMLVGMRDENGEKLVGDKLFTEENS